MELEKIIAEYRKLGISPLGGIEESNAVSFAFHISLLCKKELFSKTLKVIEDLDNPFLNDQVRL